MKGARTYASLFETGQYGRLYIVSSSHARGDTFRIFVLPEGEKAISNGKGNPCLNKDAVCVFGVISGQPGWTEQYGWLHEGKWIKDFKVLAMQKAKERADRGETQSIAEDLKKQMNIEREVALLSNY